MRRYRTLAVLACAALLPLLAPATWLRSGAFPDVGALVVVYVALRGGPAPAAFCGVLLGLLMAPFTAAPLGESSFLYGSAGFAAGAVRQSLYDDRASVQIGLAAAACLLVRLCGALATGIGAGGGLLAPGTSAVLAALPGALLSSLATAIAAPPVFGLLSAAHLFPRRRSVRGV